MATARIADPASLRENLDGDAKEKGASGGYNQDAESTNAPVRGRLPLVVMKQDDAPGANGAGLRARWVRQ